MKHNTLTILALTLATSLTADAALNMALRLDATQFTSAGAISTWEDSSGKNGVGNGYDATASGATQPSVNLTGQNSLPTVEFDGSDDFMSIGHTFTAGTVFVVANYNTATFGSFDGLFGGDTNITDQIYFTGDGGDSFWFGASQLNSRYDNGSGPTSTISTLDQWNLFSGTDSSPQSLDNWLIGTDRGIGGRSWDGSISEIIVYEEVLSEFDRQGVEVYLNEKWGLPTALGYADGTYNTDLRALQIVPEPSSTALLGLGGLALMLRRKRS